MMNLGLWRKSSDVDMRVCRDIYSNIQKYHCEKAEMGLDGPKLLSYTKTPQKIVYNTHPLHNTKYSKFHQSTDSVLLLDSRTAQQLLNVTTKTLQIIKSNTGSAERKSVN